MHYYRVKRGGTALISKKQQAALKKCTVSGCDLRHHAKGFCQNHWMIEWKNKDPENRKKSEEYVKNWRKNNPQSLAKNQAIYRQRHKEQLAGYYKKWKSENWPALKAYIASRKKRVRRQTPKWANLEEIRDIYLKCPAGHHVDHIIPINGKSVSGLHIPKNLQYLPAIENLRKSNKIL